MIACAPAKPRLKRLKPGQAWHVVLPKGSDCTRVRIEEVTPQTVVFCQEAELGRTSFALPTRYPRADVRFVERIV